MVVVIVLVSAGLSYDGWHLFETFQLVAGASAVGGAFVCLVRADHPLWRLRSFAVRALTASSQA